MGGCCTSGAVRPPEPDGAEPIEDRPQTALPVPRRRPPLPTLEPEPPAQPAAAVLESAALQLLDEAPVDAGAPLDDDPTVPPTPVERAADLLYNVDEDEGEVWEARLARLPPELRLAEEQAREARWEWRLSMLPPDERNAEAAEREARIAERKEVVTCCDELLKHAREFEPTITDIMKDVAAAQGGHLEGLDCRLKSRDSLLRKARADVEESQVDFMLSFRSIKDADRAPEPRDAVRKISDVLRYTVVLPSRSYTDGTRNCLTRLNGTEKSSRLVFKNYKVKNFWEPGDSYQGLNSIIQVVGVEFRFECQFHTPESFRLKTQCHDLYEKFRVESDEDRKLHWFREMVKAAERVPPPPQALSIPVLTRKAQASVRQLFAGMKCDQAAVLEPAVTPVMTDLFGSGLRGLQHRLKTAAATARKLKAELRRDRSVDVPEVARERLNDALRYTVVIDFDNYTQRVNDAYKHLEDVGMEIVKVDNYWHEDLQVKDKPDKGLHMVVKAPGGEKFEIQWHTPDSYQQKTELRSMHVFRKYRLTKDPAARAAAIKKLKNRWQKIADPPAAKSLRKATKDDLQRSSTSARPVTRQTQKSPSAAPGRPGSNQAARPNTSSTLLARSGNTRAATPKSSTGSLRSSSSSVTTRAATPKRQASMAATGPRAQTAAPDGSSGSVSLAAAGVARADAGSDIDVDSVGESQADLVPTVGQRTLLRTPPDMDSLIQAELDQPP